MHTYQVYTVNHDITCIRNNMYTHPTWTSRRSVAYIIPSNSWFVTHLAPCWDIICPGGCWRKIDTLDDMFNEATCKYHQIWLPPTGSHMPNSITRNGGFSEQNMGWLRGKWSSHWLSHKLGFGWSNGVWKLGTPQQHLDRNMTRSNHRIEQSRPQVKECTCGMSSVHAILIEKAAGTPSQNLPRKIRDFWVS